MGPAKHQFLVVEQTTGTLVITDLVTRLQKQYKDASIHQAYFNEQGTSLLLAAQQHVHWIDLLTGRDEIIHNGEIHHISFDKSGAQVVFLSRSDNDRKIYFFKQGMIKASVFMQNNSPAMPTGWNIADAGLSFSPDATRVYFSLKKNQSTRIKDADVISDQVDVYHYKDDYLQHTQAAVINEERDRAHLAVASLQQAGKIILLEEDNLQLASEKNNKYVVLKTRTNNDEAYYREDQVPEYTLVSVETSKKLYSMKQPMHLSPDERFVVWHSPMGYAINSYEIASGTVRNLTDDIKIPAEIVSSAHGDKCNPYKFSVISCWLPGGKAFLVGDKHDLWKIDPSGAEEPVCITEGYGRAHKIIFASLNEVNAGLIPKGQYMLKAIDDETKRNGFGIASLDGKKKFKMGALHDCQYTWNGIVGPQDIKKAGAADLYLVTRHKASDVPNLYITGDLNIYKPISDIHPHKQYNWMTSELITYPMRGGETGQGILYKPEDFDPNKKYPVIFHYYQQRSDELHVSWLVGLTPGVINIPLYVSNGYLVFVPDILNNEPGKIAKRATDAVVSAVEFLKKYPWFNTAKMGLQGHSFGGYETNLIVANTNLFSAAQASSGPANAITAYGEICFGKSGSHMYEMGQPNLRTTPWDGLNVYIENSPILQAERIVTPLLLQHSKNEDVVPFHHALSMYTALRRLQKPVWLLQYDDSKHLLDSQESQMDFAIRQQQFFDHFLKDKPAPLWMVEGIPAKYKGIKSGFQLVK